MDTLEGVIKAHIRTHGPMTIETFMGLALGHPTYGYYITRDPLGQAGDFTTAPEISQLFGEMIGLCLADAWLRAGAKPFALAELGPGRGTLMADILRATKHVPDFHARMSLHLVETSPVLRAKQKEALHGFNPQWHDSVNTLPRDVPLLIVANEFFDALPIRQAVDGHERVVGLDDAGKLTFGLVPCPVPLPKREGFLEFSPIRDAVTETLAKRIATQGGLMLAIDYGHDVPDATGDTLQAVYRHTFCEVLAHIGDADLTSHVDFYRLREIAKAQGCAVYGSVTQKDFLEELGIRVRYGMLKNETLKDGMERLLDPAQMGALFRVIAVSSSGLFPAGFGNRA